MSRPGVRLVLASASPARLRTLRNAGVVPTVMVSAVDEAAVLEQARAAGQGRTAAAVALLLARAKCENVARTVSEAVVLGCDSVLELDGAVHGKPGTATEAGRRWRAMRGRSGVLHTGHWLVDTRAGRGPAGLGDPAGAAGWGGPAGSGTGDFALGEVASTEVRFAALFDEEIDAYVATGEPLQVAGAFTIDGLGGPFVSGLSGDPHNVVGVSLPLLRVLLGRLGVDWFSLWPVGSGRE